MKQKQNFQTKHLSVSSDIFYRVAYTLLRIANRTGLTYNEVNIILYYCIIPLTWCIMLDIIIKKFLLTPLLSIVWILILMITKNHFNLWCDKIFVFSQKFIKFFGEYIKYSVVICVFIPLIIYGILIILLIP